MPEEFLRPMTITRGEQLAQVCGHGLERLGVINLGDPQGRQSKYFMTQRVSDWSVFVLCAWFCVLVLLWLLLSSLLYGEINITTTLHNLYFGIS